jgi:hypothetical protein
MISTSSRLYSLGQLQGLNRLGDALIPGDAQLPVFSTTGCIERIDTVMAPAHPDDRVAFGYLLQVFRFLPVVAIRFVMGLIAQGMRLPAQWGAPFRLLDISLRGVVYSLYYSDHRQTDPHVRSVHDAIGYRVSCPPITDAARKS